MRKIFSRANLLLLSGLMLLAASSFPVSLIFLRIWYPEGITFGSLENPVNLSQEQLTELFQRAEGAGYIVAFMLLTIYAISSKPLTNFFRVVFEGTSSSLDEEQAKLGLLLSELQQKSRTMLPENVDGDVLGRGVGASGVSSSEQAFALEQEIDDVPTNASIRRCIKLQSASLIRVKRQASELEARATRTLSVGIGFCLVGLLFLIGFTFFPDTSHLEIAGREGDWNLFAQGQVPRLSLVLIIEVIGFFFLRVFVQTLKDLRFVHNETTNMEAQYIALMAALGTEDDKAFRSIVEGLANVERNAVLSKGQTTYEIEKARASSESATLALNSIGKIIHGTGGSSAWSTLRRNR